MKAFPVPILLCETVCCPFSQKLQAKYKESANPSLSAPYRVLARPQLPTGFGNTVYAPVSPGLHSQLAHAAQNGEPENEGH